MNAYHIQFAKTYMKLGFSFHGFAALKDDHVTAFSGKIADFVPTYAVIASVSQTPYFTTYQPKYNRSSIINASSVNPQSLYTSYLQSQCLEESSRPPPVPAERSPHPFDQLSILTHASLHQYQ